MRLFFAFTFENQIKQKIYENIKILQKYIPKGLKWVEKENLHITFRFLGETNPKIIDNLNEKIEICVKEFSSFSISFDNIEVIPNFHRPRLIWYKMIEESGISKKIFQAIETELSKLNFKKSNRPLKLHTTLGRIKYAKNQDWQAILKNVKPISEKILCKELTLFKSQLTSSGPIYSIVKKFPLSQNN